MEVPLNSVEVLDVPFTSCWQSVEPMKEARYGCAAAALFNCLTVVGGMNSKKEPLNSVETFNPVTKEWASSTPMRTGRYFHTAVALGEHLYVCGGIIRGQPGGPLVTTNRVERFCPGLELWEVMPKMEEARSLAGGAVLCPMLTVGGNTSAATAPERLKQPTLLTSSSLSGSSRRLKPKEMRPGHLYLCGGEDASGESLALAERFDPALGKWAAVSALKQARAGCSAATAAGAIYVAGGADKEKTPLDSVERFDPAIGAWGLLPAMTCSRRNCAAVAASGILYVFGGEGSQGWAGLSTAERFDPELGMWEPLQLKMSSVRSGCAAAMV